MNGSYEDTRAVYTNNCDIKSLIVNIYIIYRKNSKTIENYRVSYFYNNDCNWFICLLFGTSNVWNNNIGYVTKRTIIQ